MWPLFRPAGITERVIALKAFPSLELGTFTLTAKGLCRRCGRFRENPRSWQRTRSFIVFREVKESELRIVTWLHVEDLTVSLASRLRELWKQEVLREKSGHFRLLQRSCLDARNTFHASHEQKIEKCACLTLGKKRPPTADLFIAPL